MQLKDRAGWGSGVKCMMVGEGKKEELTLKQRVSEKLGRAEWISESKRVVRKVRGPGLGPSIRTFRP